MVLICIFWLIFVGLAAFHFAFGSAMGGSIVFLMYPVAFGGIVHVLRLVIHDIRLLPQELANFDVRETHCYCCTNRHVDPVTGNAIACDRRVVYKTIKSWFGREDVNAGVDAQDLMRMVSQKDRPHLDVFNAHVLTGKSRLN